MKKLFILSVVTFAITVFSAMIPAKPKHIIFFGDSITQAGVQPGGYVDRIKKALDPNSYQVTGAGIGGNKVYDLYLRLENDVLAKKPDMVVIYIGVNDVWHKSSMGTGTDYDKFIKFYQALIDKIGAGGAKMVLCTPAVIGEKRNGANDLDTDLERYSGAIRELAKKNNLPLCDLRQLFTSYIAANNPYDRAVGILTTDGVHLNEKGNTLVADNLLKLVK